MTGWMESLGVRVRFVAGAVDADLTSRGNREERGRKRRLRMFDRVRKAVTV